MRCYVCDRSLENPVWNRDLKKWEMCPTCLEHVHDALEKWRDQAIPDEDEWEDTFRVSLEEYMKNPEKYGVLEDGYE